VDTDDRVCIAAFTAADQEGKSRLVIQERRIRLLERKRSGSQLWVALALFAPRARPKNTPLAPGPASPIIERKRSLVAAALGFPGLAWHRGPAPLYRF
jgi:hypothetical protein